jgi:CDP-paratose 2-epimerase
MVLDSAKAKKLWKWQTVTSRNQILEEIARHAEANPNWLETSAPL